MKNKTKKELLSYIDSLHDQIAEIKQTFLERKEQDERNLHQQIDFSDIVIDSLPGVFYMFDKRGKFYKWNENFLNVTEYSGDEIEKMSPWDLFEGDDKKHIIDRVTKGFELGVTNANASFITKSGKKIPYYFTGAIVNIGNIEFLVGSGIDISEVSRAQTEITKANMMLQAVINTIPVRVFWKNKDLVYLGCNDEFAKDAGFEKASDIIGKSDKDLVWKDNAKDFKRDDKNIINTRKPKLNYEETQERKDGETGSLLTSKVPLINDSGEVFGVLGSYWDITKIKENEIALKESDKRYELVLKATQDGIWDWYTNSDRVYFSDQWKAQLGYKPDELDNTFQTWSSLLHPDDLDRMQKAVQDYLENPEGYFEEEFRMRHINGTYRWIRNKAVLQKDKDGRVIRLVGAHTDITGIKEAKAQIDRNVYILEELNDLRNKVIQPIPFEEKLNLITKGVVDIFNADFARIWLISEGDKCDSCTHANINKGPHICKYRDKCLKLISSSGRYNHTNGEVHQRVPFDCYKIGKIASGKEDKFLTNNVTTDKRVHNQEWAKELDLVSFAGYKIMTASGDPIGVFALFSKKEISKDEDALLENLSNTITQIYNTYIYEQELKNNKQFIESILDVSPDLIYIYDIQEFKNIYSNEGVVNILDYSKEEVIDFGDQLLSKLMHADDFQVYLKETFPAYFKLKEKEVIEHEYRMLHKNGKWVWLRSKELIFLYDQEGKAKQIFGIIEDVTMQKSLDTKLKESESKMRSILDSVADAIIISDTSGFIKDCNPIVEKLYGYSQDEMIGMNAMKLIREDYHDTFKKFAKELQEKGEFQGETIDVRKDGTEFNTEVIGTMFSFEGQAHLMAIVRDITERKNAELILQETLHNLERSNKELEHFAYIASHDLQEPLRMITSFLQLIERKYSGKLDEDGIEYIRFAVDGANRMRQLINDLLAFSRVETKGQEFSKVDLNIVLRNALTNLIESIDESNAEIDMDPLPVINCDKSQFTQLFQNLISNAIKFKKEKDPVITIKYESRKNNHIFQFHDNGIGFEKEFSDRIFIIFQRLHTREEYEGTGIGLTLCKRIVERHGGEIWAESELGKGSVFSFSIPFSKK
ncbi:PAS domain S-box protein [Bacteroidota bacterium]